MPAIPRGWQFGIRTSTQTQIELIGLDGIAHVLTGVQAGAVTGGTGTPLDIVVQVVGYFDLDNGNPLIELTDPGTTPFSFIVGTWSGELLIPPGNFLEVNFNAAEPGWTTSLLIQGYDL